MRRQREASAIPHGCVNQGPGVPSAPVCGNAELSRVLQAFPGSKPCYAEQPGTLATACWIWQGTLTTKGYAQRAVAMALWRAERSGVVRRLARGEYVVA